MSLGPRARGILMRIKSKGNISQSRAPHPLPIRIGHRAFTSHRGQNDNGGCHGSIVPRPRWSIHDLRLLHEDSVEGAADPLSDEELLRLAKLAHLDIEGGNFDRTALRRDVGAIMSCMALLQKYSSRLYYNRLVVTRWVSCVLLLPQIALSDKAFQSMFHRAFEPGSAVRVWYIYLHDVSKQDMYAPATGGEGSARLREDVVTEGGPKMQAQVLENAQETAHGQFVVPLVNRKS